MNRLVQDTALPPLMRDRSFWGMTVTQFLGAFNDNLFKQLMLLLAIPVGAAATATDQQWLPSVVFALPFVLFSGYAGFLSDRFSKRPIIVMSKVAEIAAMLLGMAAFVLFPITGYPGLLVVLFLMGTQSAFFGPGKYGILPEMLREEDLPRANGIILMTTFLAIIFGTASAGLLRDVLHLNRLWLGSLSCIAIAMAGTATSLFIRKVPAAKPDLQFRLSSLTVPPEIRRLLRLDRPLAMALIASCVFWLVSGVAILAVNSLGRVQLELSNFKTSILTAVIGLGIAIGALLAGRLCHGRADFRIVRWGLWGMIALCSLISLSTPGGHHLLGFRGSLPALILLGMAAGCFAIPVQVFLQSRPPEGLKGRMIAVMNQANFVAILAAGPLYKGFDWIVETLGWPRSPIFAMMALLLVPLAIWYRPDLSEQPLPSS